MHIAAAHGQDHIPQPAVEEAALGTGLCLLPDEAEAFHHCRRVHTDAVVGDPQLDAVCVVVSVDLTAVAPNVRDALDDRLVGVRDDLAEDWGDAADAALRVLDEVPFVVFEILVGEHGVRHCPLRLR